MEEVAAPFFDDASASHFGALLNLVAHQEATAFIGAGLSQAGGMPGWPGLYQLLCGAARSAGAVDDFGAFSADSAPAEMGRCRDIVGETSYLEIMRQTFDKPVVSVPEGYELAADAFSVLATFNYDNFLESIANAREREPRLAVYPAPWRAERYVYAHGQAALARGKHDLVTCQDDYDLAYDHVAPGGGATVLALLQSGPSVFLGSSLADPDLWEVIRHAERSRRRFQNVGGRFELYAGTPPWFAFLSANLGGQFTVDRSNLDALVAGTLEIAQLETDALAQKIRGETDRLRASGIRPIWYIADDKHSNMLLLLRRLKAARAPRARSAGEPVFLMQASELEQLGALANPSAEQQARVISLVRTVPECRRHFFERATSVAWFDVLDRAGVLRAIEEPQIDVNGDVRIVRWDAEPYVLLIARRRPDLAAKLIADVSTENWHVISVLGRALLLLPTPLMVPLLPHLVVWLDSRFARPASAEGTALEVLNRLVSEGEAAQALTLFGEVLKPLPRAGNDVVTRLSPYEATEAIKAARVLSGRAPEHTLAMFRQLLIDALEIQFSGRTEGISTWRPAIGAGSGRPRSDSTIDLLVDGLRDACGALARSHPDAASPEFRALLECGEPLLRRIAISVLIEAPALVAEVEPNLSLDSHLFDVDAFHEHSVFLHRHFDQLSTDLRTRILDALRIGPSSRPDESTDDRNRRQDVWRWRLLSVLPENLLPADDHQWLTERIQEWGLPEDRFSLSWIRPFTWKAPATVDDLRPIRGEGAQALLDAVRSPGQRFVVDDRTDRSLMWDALGALVADDPEGLLDVAPLLTEDDFEGEAWRYLDAFGQAARIGATFNWAPLIALGTRLARDAGHPGAKPAGWVHPTSRLLRDGLVGAVRIPTEHLADVVTVFESILYRYASPLAGEEGQVTHPDLASRQLNEPAGIAADGLMRAMWRCLEATEIGRQTASNGAISSGVPSLVERLFADLEQSAGSAWGGVEMRHALGEYLIGAERLQPGWTQQHLAQLIGDDFHQATTGARQAFWSGYLGSPHVYDDLLLVMRTSYAALLADIGQDRMVIAGQLQERLVEHILIGRVRLLLGFGLDGLLGEFSRHSAAALLEHAVWFFWQELKTAAKAEPPDPQWFNRLWAAADEYWESRVNALQGSLEAGTAYNEMSEFALWLEAVPVGPSAIEQRLVMTIQHTSLGHHLDCVVDYLSSHASHETETVTRLMAAVVERWTHGADLFWSYSKLEPLLQKVWASGTPADRERVHSAVGTVLQIRGVDLRSVLVGE